MLWNKCLLDNMNNNMAVNDVRLGTFDGSDFNIESSTERLILYTCYPFGENNVARTQKAVYVCSKLSGPVIGGND